MREVTREEFDAFLEKAAKQDILGTFFDATECSNKYYSQTYAKVVGVTSPAHHLIACEVIGRVEVLKVYFVNDEYFTTIDKLRS